MAVAMPLHPASAPHPVSSPFPTADELIPAAQAGSRIATEQLLYLVLPRVRNLVRYLVRGDTDVDDIAQESLSTIYRRLESFKGEGSFAAWVDRVTVRCVFAYRRRQVQRRETPLDDSAPDADPEMECGVDYTERRRLVMGLDALPTDQRDALVMHHVLGMSAREIAAEFSVPEETIRSRLRLGRARLRACLDPSGERRDDA